MTTTTLSAQLSAAGAGLDSAVLPHFLALEAGLTPVAVNLGVDQQIWLVVHADLRGSRRVRVVADHVATTIAAQGRRLQWGEREG